MLRDLWEFSLSVVRYWSSLVTGGFVMGLLGVWQGTGHRIPPTVYWIIALISLFVAFFRAWRAERDAKESAISQNALAQTVSTQTLPAWRELYNEKKRLEAELEAEIGQTELLEPHKLGECVQPDDPGAWRDTPDTQEYYRRSRKIERIKEDLEIIKEKLNEPRSRL